MRLGDSGQGFGAMASASEEMTAGEEQGSARSRCRASTNWIVAQGSLQDVISFDTTEEDAPVPGISTPLVLIRPPETEEDDFLPCQVTLLLNGKHEIHRIYARSTARVYEIYYAEDKLNNCMEYMCTVRCSVAASGSSAEFEGGNYATSEKQEKMSLSDSNCSNEDGWVEVGADSVSHEFKTNAVSREIDGNSNTDFQNYYEATAEISDFSPCTSVTLRFLSLQTKTCINISEIYIYADPVEAPDPVTPGAKEEKFGENSLMAMFMPTLLQLSKSAASRQNKFLNISEVSKYQGGAQNVGEISSPEMVTLPLDRNLDKAGHHLGLDHEQSHLKPEYASSSSNQRITEQDSCSFSEEKKLDQVREQNEVKSENMQLGSSQKITEVFSSSPVQETKERSEHLQQTCCKKQIDPDQFSKSSAETGNHIERILAELVSRTTRIEAFCSRFEESLLKPLSSMETRLQKLETLFDTFATGVQIRRAGGRSRIIAPDFSCDESDSENKGSTNSSFISGEDSISDSSLSADVPEDPSLVVKGVKTPLPESRVYTGFFVKAPEFTNESDESLENDSNFASEVSCSKGEKLLCEDNQHYESIISDATSASNLNSGEGKRLSSLDSALATALEAFLISDLRPSVVEPDKPSIGVRSSSSCSSAEVLSIGDANVGRTPNEVEVETPFADSSFSFAAASEMFARNSIKDSDCGISGTGEVAAGITDLFASADTNISSYSSSLMYSDLRRKASDLLNDGDVFENYGGALESSGNCHKDRACTSMDNASVSEERFLMEDGSFNVSSRLNSIVDKEWHESLLSESGGDQVVCDDPNSSPNNKGRRESNVSDHCSRQDGNVSGSSRATIASVSNQDNSTVSINVSESSCNYSARHTHEQPPEADVSCHGAIVEVKFIPETDWVAGVPLEILLGDTFDIKMQYSAGTDVTENQVVGDQFLEVDGMENFPADGSGQCNDSESCVNVGVGNFGRQNFSSLI